MADIGKQFINAMSSIRVADRITNLIRNDERSKTNNRADIYRVAVALAPPLQTASGGDPIPIGRDFKLTLVDKKSSDHVHVVVRAWPIIKQVILFIRGVAPKLDVPPLPSENAGAVAAVIAEDRRKFLQTYVNAAMQHSIVSNLKEFIDLIGFTEFQALHAHDAVVPSVSSSSFAGASSKNTSGTMARPEDSSPTSGGASQRTTTTHRQSEPSAAAASSLDIAPADLHRKLEECFRILDVSGAGYLTPEDMKQFFDILLDCNNSRVKNAMAKLIKDANAFTANEFAGTILQIAKDSNLSTSVLVKSIQDFQAIVFTEIYTFMGSSAERDSSSQEQQRIYDPVELRTLQFVLRVSGVRNITEQEIEAEQSLSLPVSNDDFCRLMSALVDITPLDDTVRALEKSARGDHSKLLHLICKHAAVGGATKRSAVKKLQDLIMEFGGGSRRLGKCGNCEAAEQRVRGLKLRVSDLEEENSSLKNQVLELEDQLEIKDRAFADSASQATTIVALEEEIEQLRRSVADWRSRAASLEERVKDLEGSDDEAENKKATAPTRVTEVTPLHLGSHIETSLIDLPGSLTVALSDPDMKHPSVLHFDVFYVGLEGHEYVACRDDDGRRCFGLQFENGLVSLSRTSSSVYPPFMLLKKQWVRFVVKFDWYRRRTSFSVNGRTVWTEVPLAADSICVFDAFPRSEVLYCYANVKFSS